MGYSKYHLHRIFSDAVGLTIHDYVQRRQLTEAAKLLVDSPGSLGYGCNRRSAGNRIGYVIPASIGILFLAVKEAPYPLSSHRFASQFWPKAAPKALPKWSASWRYPLPNCLPLECLRTFFIPAEKVFLRSSSLQDVIVPIEVVTSKCLSFIVIIQFFYSFAA